MSVNSQADWDQIGQLRPCLQWHMEILPQVYRGDKWFVLYDSASATHLRFNEAAYALIGRFDGELTVEENWQSVTAKLGDQAPSREEVTMILGQLYSIGALKGGFSVSSKEFMARYQSRHKLQKKFNPLAVRFPLLDPDKLLNRLIVFMRPMFSWVGMVIWSLLVGFAFLLAIIYYPSLAAALSRDIMAPDNLLTLALSYCFIKLVHEFAHALTVKNWGGEVHEMGVTLLVMIPVPHVDASATWSFRDKHKRVLVSAAGILAELFVAAMALFVWLAVEPGFVQDTALNLALIGSVSTLLFNANPLLRFDGYYMLQDFIEIPNLGTRSSRYYLYLIQRYLFGMEQARSPQTAEGEQYWFAFYGPASLAYRLFITVFIAFFLINEYLIVGVVIAIWAIATQVLIPVGRGMLFVFTGTPLANIRARAAAVTLTLAALAIIITGFVPVSLTTRADGVVWVPDQAQVFAETNGFVDQMRVSSGDEVAVGDVLVQMSNPELTSRIAVLTARRKQLLLLSQAEWFKERVQSQITRAEIETNEAELASLQEREAGLVIRSKVSGTVVLLAERALGGIYLEQGQLLGYVSKQDRLIVRSVVLQNDIGLLRRHVASVEVRLAENLDETIVARIIRETPAASSQLPSAALGTLGGGNIAVDRVSKVNNARTATTKLFQVDLELSEGAIVAGLGERAYILFDHGSEPLALQWLRLGRQLVLSRLSL